MSNVVPAALIASPILFAAVLFMLGKRQRFGWHLLFSCLYLVLAVMCLQHGGQAKVDLAMGAWSSAYAIVLRFDFITRLFVVILAFVGLCVSLFSYQDKRVDMRSYPFYVGYWLLMLAGLGLLATQDIFNLYVWLEVMLVASIAIMASTQHLDIRAALKEYAFVNIFTTLIVLLSIGMVYGQTGVLSYEGIAGYIKVHSDFTPLPVYMFLLALLVKGGSFPFYFWLPNAYSSISTSSTFMLSSINTKLIMVVLIRLFVIWGQESLHGVVQSGLIVLGVATMFFGVMGAANQQRIQKILSFHITSQIGYTLVAISLSTTMGFVAAIYFIMHNIFTKSSLFLASGYIDNNYDSDDLTKLGQIVANNKVTAAMFFIAAMSLAGFPPLSGFVGKYLVLKSVLVDHHYVVAFFALFVSLFTLYSMVKIWRYGFCQRGENSEVLKNNHSMTVGFYVPTALLMIAMLVLGLDPDLILTPLMAYFG